MLYCQHRGKGGCNRLRMHCDLRPVPRKARVRRARHEREGRNRRPFMHIAVVRKEKVRMATAGNYFRTSESTVEDIRSGKHELTDFVYDKTLADAILAVDNAWHAIQFALNGTAFGGDEDNIFSRLVLSGNKLREEDGDEFSAMLIDPGDVRDLSAALNALSEEDFRERFHVEDMLENEIYPVTEDDDEEDFFEYVWDYVSEMKEFFEEAAGEGQAVVFYLT